MTQQREDTPKTGPAPKQGVPLNDDRRGGEGVVTGSVGGGAGDVIQQGPGQASGPNEPVMDADADQRGKPSRASGVQGHEPIGQFPDTADSGPDGIKKRRG